MKLTKRKLISIVGSRLELFGFKFFKESFFQGTFIMKVNCNMYLSLLLIIDRYYDSMFTGSYYLSPTTCCASMWGDIPRDSYERVSFVLTDEERVHYSNEAPNVKDLWWDGFNETDVDKFIEIVSLTYKRFYNNSDLIKRINQSKDVQELVKLSQKTIETANTHLFDPFLEFQPEKKINDVPYEWFKAAETVIRKEKSILNKNSVISLAADAYRQFCLNQ